MLDQQLCIIASRLLRLTRLITHRNQVLFQQLAHGALYVFAQLSRVSDHGFLGDLMLACAGPAPSSHPVLWCSSCFVRSGTTRADPTEAGCSSASLLPLVPVTMVRTDFKKTKNKSTEPAVEQVPYPREGEAREVDHRQQAEGFERSNVGGVG